MNKFQYFGGVYISAFNLSTCKMGVTPDSSGLM